MKKLETARVAGQERIAEDIYSLTLDVSFAEEVRAGQFVSLYSSDASRLLPRPISICDFDAEKGQIRLVYRIAGKGTLEFSHLRGGDAVKVMGPLGNGFPLEEAAGKHVLLVGGGIGIPPMVGTGRALAALDAGSRPSRISHAAGYRTDDLFLTEELLASGRLCISTDDGSRGTHGTVLDAIRENAISPDLIFACGPAVMLRALKARAAEQGIPLWVSMEERMACGVGVCLGCVCNTAETDPHSMVKRARICADGPVFRAEEVDLS